MDAGDWLWVWIGAAVVFAFVELVTPFLFFMISFAAGAALAALVGRARRVSVALQIGVFLVGRDRALLVLVPIGRRLAVRRERRRPRGRRRVRSGGSAVVLEEIPAGRHDTGLVRLERPQWRAETDADAAIAAGQRGRRHRGARARASSSRPSADPRASPGAGGRHDRDHRARRRRAAAVPHRAQVVPHRAAVPAGRRRAPRPVPRDRRPRPAAHHPVHRPADPRRHARAGRRGAGAGGDHLRQRRRHRVRRRLQRGHRRAATPLQRRELLDRRAKLLARLYDNSDLATILV